MPGATAIYASGPAGAVGPAPPSIAPLEPGARIGDPSEAASSSRAASSHAPARWWVLGLLLVLGASLRLGAIATVGDNPTLRGDETYYMIQATSLAQGAGYPGAMRPPGFAVFLAAVTWLVGGGLLPLRLAQAVFSLLAIAIVFDLVSRRFSLKAGAISAGLLAVSPDHIHFAHFLWAESFQTTLLLGVVWLLERSSRRARPGLVVCAGIAAAAAALTREMALYLVPLFALWLRRVDGGRWTRAAILVAVVLACIAPWVIRNSLTFGRPVLISTNRWYPIAEGNVLLLPSPVQRMRELRKLYYGNPDEIARESEARAIALSAIRQRQPWWIFQKLALNSYFLFAPLRSQMQRFLQYGWIPAEWVPLARWLAPVEAAVYGVAMLLGIAGIWLVPDPRLKPLALVPIGVFLAVYVVGNAASRFRVPLVPFLLLFAGPLLTGYADRAAWRRIGAALCLTAFLVIAAVDVFAPPKLQYARHAPPAEAPRLEGAATMRG